MPMSLRPETRDALRPLLAKALTEAKVVSNCMLDHRTIYSLIRVERNISQTGQFAKALAAIIGDGGIYYFVADDVQRRLGRHSSYDADAKDRPLLEVLQYESAEVLADEMLDALCALPRSYWVSLPLGKELTEFVQQHLPPVAMFGPTVRFLHDQAEMKATAPVAGMAPRGILSHFWHGPKPEQPEACLQFKMEGFIAPHAPTETLEDARSMLRSILGLMLALRIATNKHSYSAQDLPRQHIFVRQVDGDGEGSNHSLSQAESNFIQQLSYSIKGPILREGAPLSAEGKFHAARMILSDAANQKNLLRACEWYFNSHVGEDPLLRFVQATVVLEIMLGHKASSDEIGLGTLLSNRCAYMIGQSTEERSKIIDDFKEIYGVRSQIVHSGKHRLNADEQMKLHQLQHLGRRVICAEIGLAIEQANRDKGRLLQKAAEGRE